MGLDFRVVRLGFGSFLLKSLRLLYGFGAGGFKLYVVGHWIWRLSAFLEALEESLKGLFHVAPRQGCPSRQLVCLP